MKQSNDALRLLGAYDSLLGRGRMEWSASRDFERQIGAGGQGAVFLSHRSGSAGFQLPVALKLFSPEPYESRDAYRREMQRITGVASTVAHIQHDNLVDVHNVWEVDGISLMEMEWVDGYDLRCLLTPDSLQQIQQRATRRRWTRLNEHIVTAGGTQPRVKPALAIAIIRACLAGLSALHRNGIVHNDLKPSNIMLKRSGSVKLIDIGSALSLDDVPEEIPCTPEYAAPEVLEGESASPQTDLASLGYILLEVLSGTHPFGGMRYARLLTAKKGILDELPRYLPPEEFAYSDLLIPLLRRLVNPDPSCRFSTADEARLSEEGVLAIEQELVKSDLSSTYEKDIRDWMLEVDADTSQSLPQDEMETTIPRPALES
ncbi:protein kinase [bacterium]|nr:protein kinase [bacterium]